MSNVRIRFILAGIISLLMLALAFGQNNNQHFAPYKMFQITQGDLEEGTVYKFQDYDNTCYIATGRSRGFAVSTAIFCLKNK